MSAFLLCQATPEQHPLQAFPVLAADTTMRVWTLLMRMCCVFPTCVRASSVYMCGGTPRFSFLFFVALLLVAAAAVRIMSVSHRPSRSQALCFRHSHGTTVAHQVLPFVTATDGASVCACVCVLCFICERTHISKRGARTLRRGGGDTNLHFLGFL